MNSITTHLATFVLGMHFAMLLWQIREWRRDVRRERREAATKAHLDAIERDGRGDAQRRFEELDAEVKQRADAMRSGHDAQVYRVELDERALRTPQ